MVNDLALPSGCRIPDPADRLLRFAREEYDYYDAIPSEKPNHVSPTDVMVTIAVNSFVNSATKVRAVHRSMASACDPLLATIPEDADILSYATEPVLDLLHAAVQGRGVLIAVATKILHRKRRSLIPMLDAVVIKHYAEALGQPKLLQYAVDNKHRAAEAAATVLDSMRGDLAATIETVEKLRRSLHAEGFTLSALRILEILLWTEVEPVGYYR